MNGKRYLLDTNAIIQLLAGNAPIRTLVEEADFLAVSVICQLEFLAYPGLTDDEAQAFAELLTQFEVFDLMASDTELIRETLAFRTGSGLKLPDAIIAATALVNGCEIVSNDAHFRRQTRVAVRTYPS